MQTVSNFLLLDDLSEDGNEVMRGSSIQRQIRVQNLVEQKIELNLWIDPTDQDSEPLWRWCALSEANLILEPGKSRSITLTFEVPQQAKPSLYNYEILAEASAQYPGKTLRRPQQLRVLSSELDAELDSTPSFTLQPVTTSVQPYLLAANTSLDLTLQVENRSKLVDRFYLRCPDLPESWYTVRYPEDRPISSGVVLETDGLELNPGRTGEIKLSLHPPQYTPAAYYQPTVRLISSNAHTLMLLDVIYLQLLPDERLQVDLLPMTRRIPEEPGTFEVKLFNPGNILRQLTLGASDPEQLFTYNLDPAEVVIPPGEPSSINLRAKRRKWWRRPFWGKGLLFNVELELQNTRFKEPTLASADSLALSGISQFPALPEELPRGTVLWQPRAWWELLLLALLGLGLLGAIAFTLWRFLFWHPQPVSLPTAGVSYLGVATTSDPQGKRVPITYQEGINTPLRLDWAIRNYREVNKVTIIQLSDNREVYRKSYFFAPGAQPPDQFIPLPLQKYDEKGTLKPNNFCEETHSDSFSFPVLSTANQVMSDRLSLPQPAIVPANPTLLECHGMITPVEKAGDYVFKIEVFSRPLPQTLLDKTDPQSRWDRWFHRRSSAPSNGSPNAPSTSPASEQPIATLTTDTTHILPPPTLPTVASFSSTQLIYEEPSSVSSGNSAATSPDGKPRPTPAPIKLNWEVVNSQRIKELRLVSLTPDGTIDRELSRYPIVNGVPAGLSSYCTVGTNLVCRNVPIAIQTIGEYKFKLIVIPQPLFITHPVPAQPMPLASANTTEIAAITPSIKIQARPPQIKSFQVNGQEASAQPKQVYNVSQARAPVSIQLSWDVEDGEVQLMPAPGAVQAQGKMTYLASTPSRETITLQATNKSGETVTQAVVVEIMEFKPPAASPAASGGSAGSPPGSAAGSSPPSSSPPTPSNPDQLSPIELPPRVN